MARKNIPTVFVIFGATGDLMVKKIVPALYHLYKQNKLPIMFKIIGFARRPLTDKEFHEHVSKILRTHHIEKDEDLSKFFNLFSYHQGKFEDMKDYNSLAKIMGRIDDEWKVCSNKLFYLATPPQYNENIFKNLHDSGLTIPCGPDEGWTRVIVEKPFGKDLKTAEELDFLLGKLFKEEQIYRIDHYLAKEMLQNILSFRFTNNLLEENWNNKFIEKVELRLHEEIGVEGRGAFYDGLGALRDVGQNHLLQMLALVTMENPKSFDAEKVRSQRAAVLETLQTPNQDEITNFTYRAQYEGYKKVEGVLLKSQTETYFKVRAFLDSPRWQGVPFILESGKKCKKVKKEIVITFKHASPCLCPAGSEHFQNKVVFTFDPTEEITIDFLSKKPGFDLQVEKRALDFVYRKREKKGQYVEEYMKLLLDCIEGNQLLFLSTHEIRAMWGYVDPIIQAWDNNKVPLATYKIHSEEMVKESSKLFENSQEEFKKEIGIIGLGKMGKSLAEQLLEKGWRVVGYNRSSEKTKELEKKGLTGAYSLKELVQKLTPPRTLYLLVPAGETVDQVLKELSRFATKRDVIIESANSYYKDTIRRGKQMTEQGFRFLDLGISGGPGGARHGACLMIGGNKSTYEEFLPLFVEISVPQGVAFFEGIGAGHFVKMIHNGIEYGMMQALAEGFALLKQSEYKLDLTRATEIYNRGSVIESRLVGWLHNAFKLHGEDLKNISGSVKHTGEGKWTVQTAEEMKIKTKVIEDALKFRTESEKNPSYTGKILSALRNQFGGHPTKIDVGRSGGT